MNLKTHHQPAPNQTHPDDVSPVDSTFLGLNFAMELGYTIAVPALLFGFGGGYLDKHYGSSHIFLFSGLFIAFASSFTIIFRKLKIIMARMPKVLPKKDPVLSEESQEQEAIHDLFRPQKP